MVAGICLQARRLLAIGCLIALAAGGAYAQDPRASSVQAAARAWLAIVDLGDASAAWNAAGKKFQASMPVEGWSEAIKQAKAPLGAVTSRAILSTRFEHSLPTGAEGEYALIIYDSTFTNREHGRETVTLEREADGAWRVIGYFIR